MAIPKTITRGAWFKKMDLESPLIQKWLSKQEPAWMIDKNDGWSIRSIKYGDLICSGGTDTIQWGKNFARKIGVDKLT